MINSIVSLSNLIMMFVLSRAQETAESGEIATAVEENDPTTITGEMRAIRRMGNAEDKIKVTNKTRNNIYVRYEGFRAWEIINPGKEKFFRKGKVEISMQMRPAPESLLLERDLVVDVKFFREVYAS